MDMERVYKSDGGGDFRKFKGLGGFYCVGEGSNRYERGIL